MFQKTRHLPLDEWDETIAPYLGCISIRSAQISSDAIQIKLWADTLRAVPVFETQAVDKLKKSIQHLEEALSGLKSALKNYENKERTT